MLWLHDFFLLISLSGLYFDLVLLSWEFVHLQLNFFTQINLCLAFLWSVFDHVCNGKRIAILSVRKFDSLKVGHSSLLPLRWHSVQHCDFAGAMGSLTLLGGLGIVETCCWLRDSKLCVPLRWALQVLNHLLGISVLLSCVCHDICKGRFLWQQIYSHLAIPVFLHLLKAAWIRLLKRCD